MAGDQKMRVAALERHDREWAMFQMKEADNGVARASGCAGIANR
jgi:hypothetical protein